MSNSEMMKMRMKTSCLGGGLTIGPQVGCFASSFLALGFKSSHWPVYR